MREPELDIDKVKFQFNKLTSAFIDSSSIIYLQKINAHKLVGASIELYTIHEVIKEIRNTDIKINIWGQSFEKYLTTDEELLRTAYEAKIPIISEDKGILMKADELGMDYFNSIMILLFLDNNFNKSCSTFLK